MTLVIDASVAVKWLVEEEGSPAAVALLDESLAAPDLLISEVGNILWKKVRKGEIPPDYARSAVRDLVNGGFALYSSVNLIHAAVELGIELGHPVYDCLYLVLAQKLGTQLVTADRRFINRLATTSPELRSLARPLI